MSSARVHTDWRRLPALTALFASGCLMLGATTARADIGTDIAEAFKQGKFNVSFRYRYENVDEDLPTITEDSNASTLRSRLTYQSAEYEHFSVLLELDDLRVLGNDDYNDTRNGKTNQPVVADPEATDFNQGALKYSGLENAEVIVGRQRIVRGNERFIGPVGWRQNEQTFDAATINYKFDDKLQAYYGFVNQVNRVFGPNPPPTPAGQPDDLDGNTHLLDVSYAFAPWARVMAYGYFLDLGDDTLAPLNSNQTIGLRLSGDVAINDQWAIPYAAEYATQDDYADNPNDYSADYYIGELGLRYQKISVKLAYEVLEGDTVANKSFQTPLATLHAFQGWADKFLATPTGGIEDTYLLVDFPLFGANVKLRYDDFQAETDYIANGSNIDDYGDEFGVWVTLPVGTNYSVALKYATFNADSSNDGNTAVPQDTDKFWLMLSANF
jgi:hypothetical protein